MVARSLSEALSNFDVNAVMAKALGAAAPKVAGIAASKARKTPERVAQMLGISFQPHLTATYGKCYKIKTLIYREEPVELLSQYVSIKLSRRKGKITDNYLVDHIDDYKNVIIQGSGGSGKTMLMKYLSLCRFENPRGRIPLFIELRALNFASKDSLMHMIYQDSSSKKGRLSFEDFEDAVSRGLFLIILDGLDEVDPDAREEIHRQIKSFPTLYPENLLIISSREDRSLDGWTQFYSFSVMPLDKRQVTQVIKRIDFDKRVKEKFLKDLSRSLYEKHQSFLTNPLLATIMLLRYDQFADAGDKIYIFYDQAFETLFFKHDLSKGLYERKRFTSISVDDFRRFFAVFCFATYAKNKMLFSRAEISSFIQKALSYCQITASATLVLKDLCESVCIIMEDGLYYTFVHRSFQEYFAALFVADYRGDKIAEYVKTIMARQGTENAGKILREISPQLVDKTWGLPTITNALNELTEELCSANVQGGLNLVAGKLYLSEEGSVRGWGIGPIGNDLFALSKYYDAVRLCFLRSTLLFDNYDHMIAIQNTVGADDAVRFNQAKAKMTRGFNESVDLDEDDNTWLSHTNASNMLLDTRASLLVALDELKQSVKKFEEADVDLI